MNTQHQRRQNNKTIKCLDRRAKRVPCSVFLLNRRWLGNDSRRQPATACSIHVRSQLETHGRRLLNVSFLARPVSSLATVGVVRKQRQTHAGARMTDSMEPFHVDNGTPAPPAPPAPPRSAARRYSILCRARNQWRSRKSGVTWSYFRTEKTRLAAALKTDWSLSMT